MNKKPIGARALDSANEALEHAIALTRERRNTHGNFAHTAKTARDLRQTLTTALQINPEQPDVRDEIIESLAMISVKLARIVNGDPMHADHWRDIMGYASLALDAIGQEKELA